MGSFLSGIMGGFGASKKQSPSNEDNSNAGQGGYANNNLLGGLQRAFGPHQPGGSTFTPPYAAQSMGTAPQAQQTQNQQSINTQNQQSGFHGLVPMISNYFSNQHAAAQDTQAQQHIAALQQGNLTPEQRQFHINNLMSIYANRPEVLQQLGLSQRTGYFVPNVQGNTQGAGGNQNPSAGGR